MLVPVQVCFVGEPAINTGGPSQEFWSLLLKSINDDLRIGEEGNKVFAHDVSSPQAYLYNALAHNMHTLCKLHDYTHITMFIYIT